MGTLCEESSVITIIAEYSLSGGDDNTMEEKDLRKRKVDVSFSTKVSKPGEAGIAVVSKRQFSNTSDNYDKLKEKFDKIEKFREAKEKEIEEREKSEMAGGDIKSDKTVTFITHLNVFLYATCFWIQSGTLPYLPKTLGADPVIFGHLQTVFSVLQLLGGPIYGRIGDLYGERTALLIAFISYSLPVLFLSRVPSVFLHVMQGSQMIITGTSSETDRATALARLGFSYGVGMVVGPT